MTDPRDSDAALLAKSGRRAEAELLARPVRHAVDPLQEMMGCPPPVWLNDNGDKAPDGRCVVYSGPNRCTAGATHWAWIGCTLGEHLDKSAVCGPHGEAMAGYPTLHCKRCWDALRAVSDATIIKIERIGPDERDTEAADRRLVGLLPPRPAHQRWG